MSRCEYCSARWEDKVYEDGKNGKGVRRMTEQELKQYYEENFDFKDYVDKFCQTGKYTIEQALKLKIVENITLSYQGKLNLGDVK